MKASFQMEFSKEKESLFTIKVTTMKVNLKMALNKAKAFIFTLIKANMKESGLIIKLTGREN